MSDRLNKFLFELIIIHPEFEGAFGVVIPFVCEKLCGKCCTRNVEWSNEDIVRAAKFLGYIGNQGVADFINKYIGSEAKVEKGGVSYKPFHSESPCLFLTEDKKCSIYSARPTGCSLYPFTDFGDGGICPGKSRFDKVFDEITAGYYIRYDWGGELETLECIKKKLHRPGNKRWEEILKKFLSINPTVEELEIFLKVNLRSDSDA
ncbi:MAG: YkgJ family cysteine cluster protein [Candidatus Freyarchaeum deiterrae]